ncbi:MAG: 16S rRNA (cytidine(1402)-2'-O)-methyltransferase [Desulfatiglandaceae bacterium]
MEAEKVIPCRTGPGTLFVVATPLGNLGDMTYRAVETLSTVDVIAAENVSRTRALCARYTIRTKVVSYRRGNQKTSTPGLIEILASGKNIALVSDAGTPGISDPGGYLVNSATEARIEVRPIPGPCSVTGALSVSAMPAERFVFLGFLPNKAGRRRRLLASLKDEEQTAVFFEAPHRLRPALSDLKDVLGERRVMVAREMTKVFEEFIRGPVSSVLEHLPASVKGELTIVVEGCRADQRSKVEFEHAPARVDKLLNNSDMRLREAAERFSAENNITYRRAYKICLKRKKFLEQYADNGD